MDNKKPPPPPLPTVPPPQLRLASNVPLNIFIDDNSKKKNKFSSILITQLNETISSTADIDVKVIQGSVSENNKQKVCESIECQTDDDIKFEKYFTEIKPTFSDIESVGFYYFDADSNHYIVSDDEFVVEENSSDECIGFEVYNRKSNKNYAEPKSLLKYKIMSTQTVLSILPERNRSTQTSPSLLRDYLMNDLTNILSNVDCIRPTNEEFVNKLKNEQYSLLVETVKSRSDSINEESMKSSSESTSFENPLCEKNVLKHAEICRNDSDKLKKYKIQNADSINSENNSFHTVATHFTSTNTVPSENCTINEPESFEQFDVLEVIDNFLINGQVVSLNETLGDNADSSHDQNSHDDDNEGQIAQSQSDRTSVVSDVNSDEDDDEDESKSINPIAGLIVTGKLLNEFYKETMIEEEYVKDKYEIYYPESDKVKAEQKASEILNQVNPPNEIIYDESKRKIKFNDDLDIIDPSEYSTPTTSTSNLQQFLSSDSFQRIDCTSDEAEVSPPPVLPKSNETKRESIKYNNFSTFKWQASTAYEKKPQTKTDQSPSIINEWDNTPVKPYNSTFDIKSPNKLDSNLEKTLKTFDMKESKKSVKYIEKYSNLDVIPKNVFASESLERRLRASGFNDLIIDNDGSRKAKPPPSPQMQLPVLDTQSPERPESPESPPHALPVISQPAFMHVAPERPPLPNLPLTNPILPPRISQNSKFETKDKPPLPIVLKKNESYESLDDSTIHNEFDQINNRRESNSSTKPLIIDTIEETTVSTSIITEKRIIEKEDVFHSPLSPLQNMQKLESESMNDSSSSDIQTNKKLKVNESKFTFDEPSYKKFDVDLTFYDEESVLINHEQTSFENFHPAETPRIDEENMSTAKERHLSTESKITLDIKKPNIIVDFSIYDEEPKNTELVTTSELTDVTTNTSRDRFSSLSNESKLLLNTSINMHNIDVDFSIYDEETKTNKTPVDEATIQDEQAEKRKQSLVKESKLVLDDLKPIKQFDINFDEYEQHTSVPQPLKPPQKGNLSLSNASSLADKTTSSDTASTTRKKFQYDAIDIPIPTSLATRKASLSTESKLIINNDNKNIIKFDVDFSIYDEEPKDKELKPLTKNSIISLDKENNRRYDVDFDAYDENKASLNNSLNENKRDKLRQIDNIIGYQSPNLSSQSAQKKQPVKFDYPDWENMLNMVQSNQIVANDQDDGSYNIDCSDNDDNNGDDDDAGTEADIDDNDDQENDLREFELNNNTNGIVNMVFEPLINHAELFNSPHMSPKKLFNEQTSPKLFENEQISPKRFYNEQTSPKQLENFFPPKKNFNQDFALPPNQIYNLNEKDQKICISSVAPTGVSQQSRKPHEHYFTTHIERGEIRIDDKYDAQFESSGYTPGSTQNQPVLFKKPTIQIADPNTNQHRLKIIPKESQNDDIQNLLSVKQRLREKSGTSIAETSSIITETSVDTSFKETGKYIKNDSYSGKLTRIQKLMLSIADREKQKLLRRVDRRKERVPEILELLKTAKGKEKKRLEEELALLLRKEKKDQQLKKKFNLIDELDPKSCHNNGITKVESEEVLDHEVSDINTVKSSRSASATSLLRFQAGSGSASGFSAASGIFNDGYSSAGGASMGRLTSIKSGARESGYSSCDESGAEFRHRKRYSSYGSESRLERVDDDYSTLYPPAEQTNENSSSLHSAIRSAVNRLPIDSSTIGMPSNSSRVLTKSPTLQIGYSNIQQPAAYKTVKFPPSSNCVSQVDENDEDYPQYEYRIARNQNPIELHSTELRPAINSCMKSFTSNRDKDKNPANGSNAQSSFNNSNSATSSNKNNSLNGQNRNRDNSEEDGDRRKPTNNQPPSRLEAESMRIQYIDEESLGENYEANYNVEQDRQTGESIIMDYKNNIKFIIKKEKKEKKRPRSQTDPGPLVIEYITKSALNSLSDFEIEYDSRTGEPYIQDPKNVNHRWIILPDDWEVQDGSNYLSEEDIDLMEWNVFVENDSNRKYILDERDGKRYFIVPKITKQNADSFAKQFSNVLTGLLIRANSLADAEAPASLNKRQSSASNFQVQWPRPPSILNQITPNEVKAPLSKTGSQKSVKAANAEELIVKDDEEQQPRRRLDEQPARVEYIDEQQLGDNYEMRYRVQLDSSTGESFILDYDNNIKYVIMKKKPTKPKTEPEVVEYIMRSVLDNLGGVEIEYDNRTAEPYIRDPQNDNRRWIVLSDDWDEVEGADYIPEEDVSTEFDIYMDKDSNRKYIVDDRDGKRYYIVPQITDKKVDNFLKQWSQKSKQTSSKEDPKKSLSLSNITQANFDSVTGINDETIKIAPDAKNKKVTKPGSELMISYVEEKDLDGVNLQNVPIFQDPLTDESYIQDPQNNRIWIILPQDWRDLGLYIPDEEIDYSGTDVFEDDTKRKYVIDDQTGYRYFIVPTMDKTPSLFKRQWPALSNLVNKYDQVLWRKDLNNNNNNNNNKNKKPDNNAFHRLPPLDIIENYDREPKYAPNKQKSNLKPFSIPRLSRKEIPRSLVLPISPRPLHHLLLDGRFTHKRLQEMYDEMKRQEELLRTSSLSFLNQDWRYSNINDDPTASRDQSLDRNKLIDIEINGYNKERKGKRRRRSSLSSLNSRSTPQIYSSALASASGASLYSYDSPFLQGVLTEKFGTQENWKRNHRAVRPKTRLFLREQVLATPRSQERVWRDTLEKSYKLKPRIIVINDDERILAANKNCKFYVQYVHDHDSILGADPAYLLMLPDRGPVNPTRPLMVSMKQLEDNGADIALREAPVFVYHQNGNAYFENIAQYLAGKYPKLSPKTLRKILQFKSLEEFEQYLEGKMTRDEAHRILESTGLDAIDVDSVKNELLMSLSPHSPVSVAGSEKNSFYHANCEYDSLRYDTHNPTSLDSKHSEQLYETQEVEIGGILLKSTFVSLTPSGNIERLEPEDLTPNLIDAIKQADEYEEQKQLEKRLSNQNRYEKNPIAGPIIKSAQAPRIQNNENRPMSKPVVIPFDERTNILKSKYQSYNKK